MAKYHIIATTHSDFCPIPSRSAVLHTARVARDMSYANVVAPDRRSFRGPLPVINGKIVGKHVDNDGRLALPGYKWLIFQWVGNILSVDGIPWDEIPYEKRSAGCVEQFPCLMVRQDVPVTDFELEFCDEPA